MVKKAAPEPLPRFKDYYYGTEEGDHTVGGCSLCSVWRLSWEWVSARALRRGVTRYVGCFFRSFDHGIRHQTLLTSMPPMWRVSPSHISQTFPTPRLT